MKQTCLVLFSLTLLTTAALAQEIPCENGPCLTKAKKKGTRFLIEVGGGGTFQGNGGLALGGIFGIGGKFRGFPLAFYGFAEFNYSQENGNGLVPLLATNYTHDRSYRDLGLGLRIYAPIYGPLRVFADFVFGATHIEADLQRDSMLPVNASGWAGQVQFAAGLQLRLLRNFSVSVRGKINVLENDLAGLYGAVRKEPPYRTMGTLNLGWHF